MHEMASMIAAETGEPLCVTEGSRRYISPFADGVVSVVQTCVIKGELYVALVKNKDTNKPFRYGIPGGRRKEYPDKIEDLIDTAQNELREEMGVNLSKDRIFPTCGVTKNDSHYRDKDDNLTGEKRGIDYNFFVSYGFNKLYETDDPDVEKPAWFLLKAILEEPNFAFSSHAFMLVHVLHMIGDRFEKYIAGEIDETDPCYHFCKFVANVEKEKHGNSKFAEESQKQVCELMRDLVSIRAEDVVMKFRFVSYDQAKARNFMKQYEFYEFVYEYVK